MNTFQEWLSNCPVQYDFLSDDQDGQIAYVFYTQEAGLGKVDTGIIKGDPLDPKLHPTIGLQWEAQDLLCGLYKGSH